MPDTDRRNHHDIGYGEDFYRALDPHYRAPAALPEAKSNNDAGYGEDFYRTLDPDAPATQKSPAVKTPLQNAPEQRGFFKEAASALASGAVSTAEALTSTAEMIGVPGAERASSYLRGVQESEALVRPDYLRSGTVLDEPARLADWRWWTRTVGENIPNALAMLVPAGAVSKLGQIGKLGTLLKGSATARRAAALGAGFSASFPLEAGSAYSNAKQEMSATGQYDADTIERIATAEGLVAGTTNAIIELLPIDSLLFKQSGGDRLLRRILRQAYIEGGTETVQEAVNILVEQYGHAPDATLKDQIGRVIEAGLAGGVIGGGFGATIGTAEHRAKTNAYQAIAQKTDLDEDIVRWKQEDLPDKNIAELVSARLDDYRRIAAPDATTQIPAKIDAAEMVSFVLYGSGRFQPDRSGAKKKAAVLRAMGMKPKTPPAEMPMTTSAADGKAVITEEQRAQAQNERAAANRKAQGKTLFDAVASEDLAETQAIEQARQDDEARRNEETVRLAAAEQASRDKAVADAQSRQDALIARLAGADPQKQALVQDVLGLSERALLSAVQKELKLTVTPAGPGAYTVETPGGPQPADLFDLRQRLAEKRSADFTARQDEEAANAAAVRRMEEEQARKKREREAAAALDMSRRSLVASLSGPTPEQLAHLNANRQRLTPDEIARLDRWMKKDRDSAPVSPPPAPRPSAVISEEVNAAAKAAPPKQDNGQDDETALVDLMLSDVANARKGGELRTDDAGETIRDTAGIAWLTAANRAGADVTVKDAKTVLNKVKTGEDLTERQQRQLTAILDAMRAAGGAKVTQALSWAKKGYIPVDNRRIAVRDMVEGDSYVIDNEEFRVTDIDDAGNVTLKDGTIKKVRDGEMLTGVDFVKPVEGAEDFSGESFDDAMKRVESEAEPPQAPPVPESRKTPPASVAVTTGLKTKAPEKRDISQLAGDLAAGRIAPGKFTFPADVTPQEINEVWDDLSAAVENIAKKNEPFIRALHEEIDALGPARTAAIKAQKKALLDKIRALQDEADALDRKITNAFEGAQAQLLDTIIERAKAEGLFIDDAESEEVYELYSTLQEGRSHDPLFIDGKIPEDYVNTWTVPLAEQILDELRAQQPTGDAYPVPNSSGVYNEKQKKAEVISFPQNKAFDAAVYVLQVGPEEWISAEDVSLKTGSYAGQSSPLTKNPVFPTRKAALADALKTVQQFGESNARDASSPATDKSRKAAAQIAQWAEKQYLELYPPSQAPSQAVAVTTGLKPKKAAALPPEMPIIRARLQHLKSLGVNTAGYDEWVKVMESGDAAALANEPPAQDTLRAINLTIAEEEKILKAQAQEKGFGAGNTLFTEDKAAKARAILKAKLSGAQLNAGIDPEILTAGIDLAGYYIEGGVRKFADFTAKMVEDIGEQIRPYLKSLYLAVRNYPGFDNAGMETEADIEKSLTAAAATDKIAAKGEKSHADSSDLDAGAAGNAPAAAASARQAEQNAGRLPEDVRAVVSGIEGQARREGSDVPQGVNLPAEIQAHAEQYLYHATYADKIAGINAAGLDPTKSNQYIYGNDTTKRVYLSPDQELSLAFGDVLLRVRRSALNQKLLKEIARQGGQEVWYFDRIAPSLIERLTPRGEWAALSAQTEKIPQSVAVTTGAKTPKTKESPYMAAVGLISGGRADRAVARGYVFAYGPADAATQSEMVGLFSGLAADKLIEAGITIERKTPAAFKKGDRVVMKNGRHGEIIADESYTMIAATIFGGQRNVERYENYRVRTDAGAEFGMIKPEDLTKETEKPAEPVVPDIKLIDGHFNEPDRVLNRIALHQSNEQKKRASAQRARKQDNIDKLLEAAEKEKRIAAGLRARYDEWAAKYPDEAAKHAPAKTLPPIGQVHPSIREKYAAKPTAAAAKAYPDLTVSGHPKPVPDHPDASYVVHIRKPDLIPDTFRVVVSAQRAAGGGFLTQAGTGMTPEQAYDNALANYDRTIETRRSSTNQDAESVTNTTTPVDNEKTNDYNKIEQEAQDAPSDRHDTDETSSEDDRAGAQGPGTRDVSATSDERSTSGVSQGTRRADDEHVRGPVRGTLQAAIRHESDLSGTSPAPDFRTQPGVGRNNGDVADVQRSAAGERTDHVITPGAIDRTGSWFQTAKNNLDIIELAKKIQTENRPATPTEQALLARYTGFGASEIANRMFPGWAEAGEIQLWRADQKWKPLVERMQKLFSPAEIATTARSTQYAHYTSPAIIDSIYKALDGFGFPGGRVLEPGMGVGSFFGLMPESMRTTTKYTGIEMDGITAQIAKLLYPRQNIIEGDYTKAQFPNNYFDLAIGNPPYAKTMILADPDYKKLRLSLHDFFFVKSLDKIRPGGLMVFITSRYTMDKVDSRVRKILNEKSDLLGAVRLPQTAFAKNAGTEVVTDVIFLRKKVPGEKSAGMMWGEVAPVTTPEGDFRINEYYLAHPEMVLGDHSGRGKMQNSRDPQYTVLPREGNIEEAFAQAVTHLPKAVYSLIKAAPAVQEAAAIERDFNPQNKKEGGLYLSPNGQVMVTESGAGVPITAIAPKLSDKDRRWLTSYITLRDAVKQCQYDQLTDGDWESSLKELNRVYKAFKMAWGRINAFTITERKSTDEDGKEITIHLRKFANSRLLRLDVESPLVMALEKVTEDFQIADGPFLSSRTIKKPEPPQISTVADALAVSLNEKGRLDLAHIASLMGASEADVFEQLGDLVYDTPDKGIQLADAYLSGNVVKKLEEAKAAAKIDPKYERNVQALIASLPKPLTAKDITPSPGATWIPLPVYNDFLHEVLELPESAAADHSPADNQWTISGLPVQSQRGRASAWSSPDRGANEIFSAVLNNATLKVYKTEKVAGVEKTYLDPAATAQVNDIAKKMKIRFRNWVWENAGRAHELLNIYNSTRNNIVPRRFDGSHLTLPGVSLRFKLMPHQKNAIWRIIQDGNTYIAHAVGAGKTYEMVAAGMEMKRLSLISKPLYVVPNHMLQQFANEFQELYPLAHVMVADEENFHTTNRRRFMAQAALNNPDAIVITHSAFGLLKMKQENILPVRNDVVSEMQAALDDLEGDKKANRIRIKQMEARIEQTEQRFESMIAQGDNVITFEDMGVDFLFVDEAHQFRKLDFTTNRQAKGVDPSGSVRAMMLYIKTQWLDRQNPGRSHVFASGTPITNTMGELYTVMKFFDMDGLRRDGLDYFDSWAAEYGDMNSAPEMNAAGRYEIVDRFSRFVNVPELMSRVRSFMDVLTSSQLGAFVKRPKVRGGQPTIVVTPASPALKNYQTNVLLPRIESSKNWKPSKEEPGNPDPLINIITDGRLASIDMRFVAPGSPNDPDSKLNKYIDKIIEHYKETAGHTYLDPATGQKSPVRGAAQICFYNHGFGRGVASSRGFDARAWAMRRFKEAGIPVDEIAWIDDFDTAAKKEAVMKEVRNGHKRILIGSAKKMGTGMNVQTRLSHMTYLDPPWYPSDVEQPVGRILRQGNQNEEVGIFYFSTKGSYDATMWQMVTRKAKFIEDALAGGGARAIEDISESSLYEMAAALASGDERAIRLAGLRNEIEGLENLRSAHYHTQTNLQREKRLYEIGHPGKKAYVAKLEAAMQKVPFDLRYLSAQHPIKAKLGHRDYTDRKAFAQDLLAKIVALRNAGTAGTTPIGHFFGLELRVVQAQGGNTEVWDRSGQTELIPGKVVNQLQLRITDDVIYDVASDITDTSDAPGLVTRLTNRAKAVPSDLAQAKQSLEETETELKKINARLGAPFELARELEEKIAEAAQIDADLVREGQATTTAQQQQHTAPAQTPDQTPPDTSGPMLSRQDKTAHRRPHRLGDVELDEMVQQLAALLKGVKIVKHGNEIRLKTRSGEEVRIESAEQIDPDTIALAIKKHYSQDKKQTPQSGAGVAGMYSAGKITLVEDMAGIWTLSHEFYHFLEDIGAISNADKATLNRKIAYLVTSQPETYGYLQGRSLPEQRADYVGRTLTGMYDATTPTGTILARIREVIDRILNALGIRTARGILRDIETGKIYKDQGERNKGQEKGKTPLLRQDIDNIRERAYTYGEGGKHETSVSDSGFDGEGSRQYPGRDAALRFQPTVVGREKKGSIPAAGRIVRTPHDAAKIAATYLNKYPDEHMISLVLDAKGKVISVYHHTIGLPGNSQASMPILAGEAMNTPGASSIIVAHNHPSQNAEFSPEDRAFARQLNNLLTGSGVTMRDFLAVAQKQYSSYSENMLVYVDDSVDINSARSGVKIPIVGRIFESVRSPLLKVSSAEDALPLAQQYIPDGGTLILDGQNALAGFSTIQNYGRIRGDAQRAILQDIEKRNGRAMIVYSPGRIVGTAESFNLGKFIAATGGQVRLLDIIDSSGSHADNGDMPAIPTADSSLFLSVAEDVTEKAADAVGRKVSRAVDLITGRVSPEKRETLSALRKSWAEFWRPFSTVTNGEEVLARRYESMGNVAKAVRFIETMKAELDQFPPETKKDIFWYLNGDIPLTVLPEDAQTFAKNIHRRTEIIGEMLVDRGLLTEETFEAHKGTYVHYLYAKHIVGEDAPVGITSSGKLDLSYTLRRNPDLTMQQRKELGLIDDASVAVPVGMGKALTDIAKFDYLETIAENPDWVWQPSVVRVAVGKKLKTPVMGRTRRYVMMGIGKLQEQVRTYDEMMRTRPTTEVAEIHKILTDAWQKEQAKTQNAPADFVQLPNTRGYGPLAGAFVKKPIADDLRPVMDVNTDRGKLLNTVLEIERQGMAAFKMGKVALNIPTACRNIVSNIIQNNMRGRALAKIPGDIVAACQSMKARDAHYEEAFGMGLFHTNWFVTEINDVLQEFRKIESGRIDQILSAVKNVAKYYGRIDDISKFAIFLQMRKAGAPIDKAAIEAMKWGMDYSLTSRSIKGLRQTIMPFATYQYKIAPLIAESLRKRPWVLAKFALIYPAAKLAAMALHDLDDDDWEDLEKQLPAYIKKSGSMMILPWKTDQDQWQWVNLEYYFPFGNMLAIFRDAKALDSGEALRDLGISNPFLSMFYTGLSAREDSPPLHAYSGIPIYNELDPGWMKAAKYLEYMANTWLPGMLTRQGALGYTGKAIAGGEDRWGREVSFGQALGRWFGFNIVSVSPEQSRAQVAVKIQDLHKEMARIEADPSRSDEAKAEYRARMNEELSQMAEQAPAAVLPITKAKGPDPVYDALRTMAARGILHTGPPSRTLEIGGIPRKMTLEQYREYLDRSSDIARRKLAALVTSPSWETMTDERKTQVVSGIVANARKAIRQKIKAQLAREFRGQQFRPQNSEKRS